MPAPQRRQTIVLVLLVFAVAGGAIRLAAPDPSALRDFGTLLLVLWLPVVGNVVGYVMRKLPRRAPEPLFPPGPFQAQLRVELTPLPGPGGAPLRLPAPGAVCTLVLGSDGFTARCAPQALAVGSQDLSALYELAFARPALALPRLPAGTAFVLAQGTRAVARGEVRSVLRAD